MPINSEKQQKWQYDAISVRPKNDLRRYAVICSIISLERYALCILCLRIERVIRYNDWRNEICLHWIRKRIGNLKKKEYSDQLEWIIAAHLFWVMIYKPRRQEHWFKMDRRKSLVLIVLLLIFCVIISIEAVSEFRHLIDLTVSKLHRLKELHCCHSI